MRQVLVTLRACWLGYWACLALVVQAQVARLPETDPVRQLQAIQAALLRHAAGVPTRVWSSAWIDENGRLHEGTQVTSDMQVRAVRVSPYLEPLDGRDTAYDVEVIPSTPSLFPPGVLPGLIEAPSECLTRLSGWRQSVTLAPVTLNGRSAVSPLQLGQIGHHLGDLLREQMTTSRRWWVKNEDHTSGSARRRYTDYLTGQDVMQAHFLLKASVGLPEPSNEPEVLSFWENFARSFDAERPALPVNLPKARLQLDWFDSIHAPQPRHSVVAWLDWPPDLSAVEPAMQALRLKALWQRALVSMVHELDIVSACEMLAYPVRRLGREFWLLGQAEHGVAPRQRFLLMDRGRLPEHLLEPGALQSLALVEVVSIDASGARLKWLAGPEPQTNGDWVAMPLL